LLDNYYEILDRHVPAPAQRSRAIEMECTILVICDTGVVPRHRERDVSQRDWVLMLITKLTFLSIGQLLSLRLQVSLVGVVRV
jgi:hypothetical protein